MRICYITDVDISVPNGPGVNEREFVVSLRGVLGHNAIFILPKADVEIDWDRDGVFFYPKVGTVLLSNGNLQIILYSLRQIAEFRKIAKERDIDLVIFRLNYNSMLCAHFLRMRKQPYAIKTLGYKGLLRREGGSKLVRAIPWKIITWLFKRAVQGAVAIDVCTEQYFEQYLRLLPQGKLQIIENSVNQNRFFPKSKAEIKMKLGLTRFDKIVGYVGGSPSQRGVAQLVEISPKLKKLRPDCGIVVVGDDCELSRLQQRAKDLGTESNFVWAGRVPYEIVADYINAFDVGIALDTEERIKAIGNSSQKIRQYLACGVPAICPKGTNLFIAEKELGMLVHCYDYSEIYLAIEKYLMLSDAETDELSRRAIKYVRENLSVEVAMQKRLNFWKQKSEHRW